jgi:LysR family carnitine catabolism transcriptional activator
MIDYSTRQLRAFQLVAQHRNFARAAEALYITPSGLSLLIRSLETQVGFRLFDRTTRHVALTPQGDELLAVTRSSLHALDAMVARLSQSARVAETTISLGAPPLVASNILPSAMREFHGTHPHLRITLFDGDLATIRRHVETGKLDIAIGIFGTGPGIRRTPFFRFSFVVIRPSLEDVVQREVVSWSALRDQPLVALAASSSVQKIVDQHLANAGVVTPSAVVVNSLDTQIAMVEAGHGMAVIPSFGIPACRNRQVAMSRLVKPHVTLDFHQITSRGRTLPAGADAFTVFLQDYIARWAGRAGIL